MGRRLSARLVKANRHYTYPDAAYLLDRKEATVRSWRKAGLVVITDTRPHVIVGEDLIAFIKAKTKPANQMAPDQFRCLTCKTPTRPLDRVVFYTPYSALHGQLEAFCEVCEGQCRRFASERSLSQLAQYFEIVRNSS